MGKEVAGRNARTILYREHKPGDVTGRTHLGPLEASSEDQTEISMRGASQLYKDEETASS